MTFSISPTFTITPTWTCTNIPLPDRLVLGVYNSAGERVKVLYDGGTSAYPGPGTLSTAVLADWSSVIRLAIPALLPSGGSELTWDGTNAQGQPVSNGSYWLKLEIYEPGDKVSAYAHGVVITRPDRGVKVGVFNGAGERVAELDLPPGADPASLSLAAGSGPQAVIHYNSPSGGGQIVWTGLNRDGLAVDNGSYTLQVYGQGSSRSLGFVLLRGPVDGGRLRLIPNPGGPRSDSLRVDFSVPTGSSSALARLYNLAGELVREHGEPSASGSLALSTAGLAPGIYVLVLEVDGPEAYRQTQKWALLR
jgi:hypothetical protein